MRKSFFMYGLMILIASTIITVFVFFDDPKLNVPFLTQMFNNNAGLTTPLTIAPVERTSVTKVVRVDNSKLVPDDDIELSFLNTGTISEIFVEEGDQLISGDSLIRLDATDLELSFQKTSSFLEQRKSELNKLNAGERDEELRILKDERNAAQTTLQNEEAQLILTLENAFIIGSESIQNKADQIIRDAGTSHPDLAITVRNHDLEVEIEKMRVDMKRLLSNWKNITETLSTTTLEQHIVQTKEYVSEVQLFLDLVIEALNGPLNESETSDLEALLFGSKNDLAAIVTKIEQSKTRTDAARDAFVIAKSNLNAKEASARSEDVIIAQAKVDEVQNQLAIIKDQIEKSHLHAPDRQTMFVKKIFVEEEETVIGGQPAILIASMDLKVQIDIPEEDIGDIREGAYIEIVLKSFSEEPIRGKIDLIEENEIIKNESTYFRAQAKLEVSDEMQKRVFLRPGMTGDVFITTVDKRDVLAIPKTATYQKDGGTVVQIVRGRHIEEASITTGASDNKLVEIIDGLTEGQRVVQFP